MIAIGETGLDYYYENSEREAQKRLFRMHIDVARETRLPLIIHTREAEDDTLKILTEEMEQGSFPHLFTALLQVKDLVRSMLENWAYQYQSLALLLLLKTPKNCSRLCVRYQITDLIETDSPFLAPVPHRGKPCEPAFVANTADFIANLREQSLEDLQIILRRTLNDCLLGPYFETDYFRIGHIYRCTKSRK